MRNAKFWINKTSNQNIEGFTITGDRKFFLSGDQIILPFSGDQKFK